MNIAYEIERLLSFAHKKNLIEKYDITPCRNSLMDLLKIDEPFEGTVVNEDLETAFSIMVNILDYSVEKQIINDSITERDLLDARIMGLLMPRASEVIHNFFKLYKNSPTSATEYFYKLSKDSNYIQVDRINKNFYWLSPTEFGDLEVTINLSKPEKDPREIALAKQIPQSGYPKCLLCPENAGFAGNIKHPPRQNLRLIPVNLGDEDWFLQYSPYVYYNEHCIVLNRNHVPMKINKRTFSNLIEFVKSYPHYFIGSNADLPIVGGSILTHDHFQGGNHIFPMEKAKCETLWKHPNFCGISISIVKWPMSVIRISCSNDNQKTDDLVELAAHVLERWQNYSDNDVDIIAFSNEPHNTVTPIARINQNGYFEMDLVLRNNRITEEFPYGIFHPHENLHHIKKENIGLIEVMGLAVLPGRLAAELKEFESILCGLNSTLDLENHREWVQQLIQKYGTDNTLSKAQEIVRNEIGQVFKQVLEDSGTFKCTDVGRKHFEKFMLSCGFGR